MMKKAPTKPPTPKPAKRAPLMPIKPKAKSTKTSDKGKEKPSAAARRARIRAILARTAAGRRELDELAAGADLSSVAHLPVTRPSSRFRPAPGRPAPIPADPRVDLTEPEHRKAWGDSMLRARTRPCPNRGCELIEHPGVSCKEMLAWLSTSERVLAGELVSPEEWPKIDPTQVQRTPRGRPPSAPRRDKPGSLLKRAKAASSSPAPSPEV